MEDMTKGAVSQEQIDAWLADPVFKALQNELGREIYQRQADTLETSKNWDEVMFNRGWCSALAYIANLRQVFAPVNEEEHYGQQEDI